MICTHLSVVYVPIDEGPTSRDVMYIELVLMLNMKLSFSNRCYFMFQVLPPVPPVDVTLQPGHVTLPVGVVLSVSSIPLLTSTYITFSIASINKIDIKSNWRRVFLPKHKYIKLQLSPFFFKLFYFILFIFEYGIFV